jgi:hypothetical protein
MKYRKWEWNKLGNKCLRPTCPYRGRFKISVDLDLEPLWNQTNFFLKYWSIDKKFVQMQFSTCRAAMWFRMPLKCRLKILTRSISKSKAVHSPFKTNNTNLSPRKVYAICLGEEVFLLFLHHGSSFTSTFTHFHIIFVIINR